MCTFIKNSSKDGHVFIGRTMEFTYIPTNFIFHPAKTKMKSICIGDPSKEGEKWITKYAFFGFTVLDKNCIADGINEKGLYVGLHYHPGYCKTTKHDKTKKDTTIFIEDLSGWILSMCSDINDVKKKINEIDISETTLGKSYADAGIKPDLRFNIADTQGDVISIEFINGNIHILDNIYNVATNSPSFEWHVENIKNYVHLSKYTRNEGKFLGDLKIKGLGQGTGLLGVPGDYSPPSRFIKAFTLNNFVRNANTDAEALQDTISIMENFSIPKGVVCNPEDNLEETTLWTTITDLHNREIYYKTYANQNFIKINMTEFLNKFTETKFIPSIEFEFKPQNILSMI